MSVHVDDGVTNFQNRRVNHSPAHHLANQRSLRTICPGMRGVPTHERSLKSCTVSIAIIKNIGVPFIYKISAESSRFHSLPRNPRQQIPRTKSNPPLRCKERKPSRP